MHINNLEEGSRADRRWRTVTKLGDGGSLEDLLEGRGDDCLKIDGEQVERALRELLLTLLAVGDWD